jgi:hypothetical protein
MPKVCPSCRYYSAGDGDATCPACGTRLLFTLLPPADAADASPVVLRPPRSATWPGPGRQTGGIWERLIGSPVALVAVFVLILGGLWAVSDRLMRDPGAGKAADSSGRIRVGMHISEVGRLLDRSPPSSPSYPRMRDYFPADEFGDGTIDYEGDGVVLKIHFIGGRVTSVEESPSAAGPGFHRYMVVVHQR